MSSNQEQLIDQISVMLRAEEDTYNRFDYCSEKEQSQSDEKIESIIGRRRGRVANWMFQVVDSYGDLSRDIVSTGMSLLDRFYGRLDMDQFNVLINFQLFQLVSLTTFNLALKLNNNQSLNPSHFCAGKYKVSDVIEMERFVLQVLAWHLHEPTPLHFVKFCVLLQFYCHHSELENGLELQHFIPVYNKVSYNAIFLAEIAVLDYYFLSYKSSTIAFTAILKSLQLIEYSQYLLKLRESFIQLLEKKLG